MSTTHQLLSPTPGDMDEQEAGSSSAMSHTIYTIASVRGRGFSTAAKSKKAGMPRPGSGVFE